MRLAIFSSILFLSGSSALIFQTLWLRLTGLEFGNSVWSAALILSSFMAGLALGNGIAATSQLRRRQPLRVYALLELAVALIGSTIVFILPHLGETLRAVFQELWGHQAALIALRLFLTFVILLIPATAMGLTLPVLVEDPSLRRHSFGRTVSLLYGWNTLGAVAGVLAGELYLVKALGLPGTALAAGSISATAAAIAWVVARADGLASPVGSRDNSHENWSGEAGQMEHRQDSASPELHLARVRAGDSADVQARQIPASAALNSRPVWRLLGCAFGCGLILLSLEVVWFRFLRLYVASSATSFAIMLAVVLVGIGVGGLVAGPLQRRWKRPELQLAYLLQAAAIATLLSYIFFPVPDVSSSSGILKGEAWFRVGQLSAALMLPVSLVSGILFPSIAAQVQSGMRGRMNSAGAVTLFNTIGAAIGPLLAAFVLLPHLGFQASLILCALGYIFLAMLISERWHWSVQRAGGRAFLGASAMCVLLIVAFPYRRAGEHFTDARRPYEADGSRLMTKVEGTADTLQLLRQDVFGQPYYYRLVTNNYSMSATHPRSQRYMRLFAYLPLTFRPESEDALLICYGVGVTADALTHDQRLKHIDIVDISKEVFALAREYNQADGANPLHDSRVTTYVQDGRFFLQACPRRYDVITGEPPPLKVAGTVNLYTQEFFSLMRSRLKAGGVASFWLPIYQLKVEETKSILLAFYRAFPNASVWGGADGEWIMLGINGPGRRLESGNLLHWWNDPASRADLIRCGVETPEQITTCFLMDADEIARITRNSQPLTDLHPKRLDDELPGPAEAGPFAWTYLNGEAASRHFFSSPLVARVWPESQKKSLEPFFQLREMQYLLETKGGNWLAALDFYLRATRLRGPVEEVLKTDETRIALAGRFALESKSPPAEALPDLVAGALARRDFDRAIHLLEIEHSRTFRNANDFFLLIYLYGLTGHVGQAEALAATQPVNRDWFVDWLWEKLRTDFGFHPPG